MTVPVHLWVGRRIPVSSSLSTAPVVPLHGTDSDHLTDSDARLATGYTGLASRPSDMDEALEAAELVADSPLEGVVTWILRILGLLFVLGGLGMWLLTDAGLLVLPAVLIVVGIVLLAAPSVLLFLAELT